MSKDTGFSRIAQTHLGIQRYCATEVYITSSCVKTYGNCVISVVTTGTVGTLSFLTEFQDAVAV